MLQTVEFETCDDYFFLLRSAAKAMQLGGRNSMMYFAAAVSDFFMSNTPTHKIQSANGPLTLQLQQTPKLLGELRRKWCPDVFCVSFKLETDVKILLKKAKRAISRYGMDCVVANELHSRYALVHMVKRADGGVVVLKRGEENGAEIESKIVAYLAECHADHIGRT
mmetsp:Transcript_737/g.1317  ORF Transcript_737/g.1317 Transcript_737/m.1317 type:complete len:166 (-) Transcript_737:190-687(-)